MKKFTFILTSMLFLLVGGVKADPVNLSLYSHDNGVWTEERSGYTEVEFKHSGFNGKYNGWRGSDWVASLPNGKIHRFVFTFNSGVTSELTLHFVATSVEDWGNNETFKIVDKVIPAGATSFQCDVDRSYALIQVVNTGSQYKKIEVVSVTREEITASSVAAPTISPASSTYDGDLSVTITKGDGNDRVVYSVSGATTGNVTNAEFTENSKTLNLTGTGTITVTATGYEGEDASSAVTNTYTYSIPSGQSSTTSGLPHTFKSWDNSITFNNSFFSNIETGDYVVFDVANVEKNGTVLGFRDGWSESPYVACTTTSGGNGAKGTLNIGDTQWWMKVNSDVVNSLKNNVVRMQGGMVPNDPDDISSSVTLNSLKVYKCKVLNESSDNSTALSSKINHVVVELTRSFVKDTWNTVCLPFTLTSAQATQLFGSGYQLTQFTSVSGTTMQFTTTDNFEAGVPYLVKPTIDVSNASPVVLVDVDITAKTPQTVTHDGYSFVGKFTQKTFSGNECSTSRFVATGNELKKPNDNSTLKSLRCYFTVPATAAARSLSFDVDEEGNTTAVANINRETITNNGDFFNLAGQRVAKPTKGLYIVNGKKVVIK